MLNSNIIVTGCFGISMLVLLSCIVIIQWNNWKKRKEISLLNDGSKQGYFYAPYTPQVKMTKQVSDLLENLSCDKKL